MLHYRVRYSTMLDPTRHHQCLEITSSQHIETAFIKLVQKQAG